MRGSMTRQALVNRYMAYSTERRSLIERLLNDQASPERKKRRETRLKELQGRLIPELQAAIQTEFNLRIRI